MRFSGLVTYWHTPILLNIAQSYALRCISVATLSFNVSTYVTISTQIRHGCLHLGTLRVSLSLQCLGLVRLIPHRWQCLLIAESSTKVSHILLQRHFLEVASTQGSRLVLAKLLAD